MVKVNYHIGTQSGTLPTWKDSLEPSRLDRQPGYYHGLTVGLPLANTDSPVMAEPSESSASQGSSISQAPLMMEGALAGQTGEVWGQWILGVVGFSLNLVLGYCGHTG